MHIQFTSNAVARRNFLICTYLHSHWMIIELQPLNERFARVSGCRRLKIKKVDLIHNTRNAKIFITEREMCQKLYFLNVYIFA